MDKSAPDPTCKPVGYIPTDAIEKITTPPILILRGVPVLSYHGEGHTAIYSAEQVRAMLAAERERMNSHAVTLAETARQVERERCAGLVDPQNWPHLVSSDDAYRVLELAADKIRARLEAPTAPDARAPGLTP